MSKQIEALRLADELEMWTLGEPAVLAAAELRRLVSFNKDLMDEVARLQKREWVGMTAKERSELWWKTDMSKMPEHDYGKAIEAKLKEKNTCL